MKTKFNEFNENDENDSHDEQWEEVMSSYDVFQLMEILIFKYGGQTV